MAPPKKRVKLVRLEFLLHPSTLAWLRLEARRRDVPIADVLRAAVKKLMDEPTR